MMCDYISIKQLPKKGKEQASPRDRRGPEDPVSPSLRYLLSVYLMLISRDIEKEKTQAHFLGVFRLNKQL